MSIFEGSPAYKKGLRRGDVIARIESKDANRQDDDADAKGMSSEQAVKLLKGPKGTSVNISIKRRGYDELIDLEVDARRGQHRHRARRVHDRQARPAT